MALIKCPECGKTISDQADSCPGCGKPLGIEEPKDSSSWWTTSLLTGKSFVPERKPNIQRCPKCHGINIEYSIEAVEQHTKGRAEVRKKSIVTRAGNAMGRSFMIGVTAGLWALTPKKSKYSEKQTSKTKIKNQKYAICKDCGNSWKV